MPALDSEALLAVHYDARRRVLRATFRGNRRSYDYSGVPQQTYDALLKAESRGAWFNAHIRDCFPVREVQR